MCGPARPSLLTLWADAKGNTTLRRSRGIDGRDTLGAEPIDKTFHEPEVQDLAHHVLLFRDQCFERAIAEPHLVRSIPVRLIAVRAEDWLQTLKRWAHRRLGRPPSADLASDVPKFLRDRGSPVGRNGLSEGASSELIVAGRQTYLQLTARASVEFGRSARPRPPALRKPAVARFEQALIDELLEMKGSKAPPYPQVLRGLVAAYVPSLGNDISVKSGTQGVRQGGDAGHLRLEVKLHSGILKGQTSLVTFATISCLRVRCAVVRTPESRRGVKGGGTEMTPARPRRSPLSVQSLGV